MRPAFASALLLALSPACAGPACDDGLPATGFFRVEERCGRALLVTPDGEPFYSTGVNHISWDGDPSPKTKTNPYAEAVRRRYGEEGRWAAATAGRLQSWGFNTVGAWSSASLEPLMPYTLVLHLAQADWQAGRVPDYFAPEWAAAVERLAAERIAGRAKDKNLVGYFLDNELRWGPDWRGLRELFDDYLLLPAAAPGRRTLMQLLSERHGGDVVRFNRAWNTAFPSFKELQAATTLPSRDLSAEARADRDAFLSLVARRFFTVTTAAVRAQDGDHLLLGARFVAPLTPRQVAQVAGEFVDVVSVNAYEYRVSPAEIFDPARFGFVAEEEGAWLSAFHGLSGRPLLISEFGFRAADSGLPNSYPPFYPTLATQKERAERLAAYAARCRAAPYIVGHHWFEYADQPATGRFDGEDNNWGLVTVGDDPYEALTGQGPTSP